MMHKLCAKNWALAMQLLLHEEHSMDKVEASFYLVVWIVLVQNGLLQTVHTSGDIFIVDTIKMLVWNVFQVRIFVLVYT